MPPPLHKPLCTTLCWAKTKLWLWGKNIDIFPAFSAAVSIPFSELVLHKNVSSLQISSLLSVSIEQTLVCRTLFSWKQQISVLLEFRKMPLDF